MYSVNDIQQAVLSSFTNICVPLEQRSKYCVRVRGRGRLSEWIDTSSTSVISLNRTESLVSMNRWFLLFFFFNSTSIHWMQSCEQENTNCNNQAKLCCNCCDKVNNLNSWRTHGVNIIFSYYDVKQNRTKKQLQLNIGIPFRYSFHCQHSTFNLSGALAISFYSFFFSLFVFVFLKMIIIVGNNIDDSYYILSIHFKLIHYFRMRSRFFLIILIWNWYKIKSATGL